MTVQRAELIPQLSRNYPANTGGVGAKTDDVEYLNYQVINSEEEFPSLPALVGRAGLVATYWTAVGVAVAAVSAVYAIMWAVSQLSRMSTSMSKRTLTSIVDNARERAPRVTPYCQRGHGHERGHGANVHVNVNASRGANVHVNVNVQ